MISGSEEKNGQAEALTRRERQIALKYAEGHSYKGIAEGLGISPATVRTHLGAIYRKLGVSNKIELLEALSTAQPESDASHGPKPEQTPLPVPTPGPQLIGRTQTLAELEALFWEKGARIVTLTGPGGAGKTTLAREIAAIAKRIGSVSYFVELAPVRDPGLVISKIVETLDIRTPERKSPFERLSAQLQDSPAFLVLDNFEQVLPAAEDIARLLNACPSVQLLVTSREALHIRTELEVAVPPLAQPGDIRDLEAIKNAPAVQLFAERARAILADFEITDRNARAVADICARLDGLPLAIELAAARVRLMDPPTMLSRLERALPFLVSGARDLPERQRTLERTIAWSYDLLSEGEKDLLLALAIFFGGGDLPAIEAICLGAGTNEFEGLEKIESLISKSLLVRVEAEDGALRFRLLETVREFGLDRLNANRTHAQIARRHALYFADFVERADKQLRGPNQLVWLSRLDTEHGNLRAAMAWCSGEGGDHALGLRIAADLGWFWRMRGHIGEASDTCETLFALCSEQTLIRATALWRLTLMIAGQDPTQSKNMAYAREALKIGREADDNGTIAWALHALGRVQSTAGDHDKAFASFLESHDRFETAGDLVGMAYSGWMLGSTERDRQNFDAARIHLKAALRSAERSGEIWAIASTMQQIGTLELRSGNYADATEYLKKGLSQYRLMDARWGMWFPLVRLLIAAAHQGHYERAAVLCGVEEALREETKSDGDITETDHIAAARTAAVEALGSEAFAERAALGKSLWYEKAIDYAVSDRDET
ncbi:MAG: tetratricopeptide repeat protein [Pseudomonadota bacterium]